MITTAHRARLQHYAGAEWDGFRWVHPQLEAHPDISRAETRFACEVALAELSAETVPTWAHERAATILDQLARR